MGLNPPDLGRNQPKTPIGTIPTFPHEYRENPASTPPCGTYSHARGRWFETTRAHTGNACARGRWRRSDPRAAPRRPRRTGRPVWFPRPAGRREAPEDRPRAKRSRVPAHAQHRRETPRGGRAATARQRSADARRRCECESVGVEANQGSCSSRRASVAKGRGDASFDVGAVHAYCANLGKTFVW